MFPLLAKRAVRVRGSPTQSEALTSARAGRAMSVTLMGVNAEQPLALVETTLKRFTPAVTLRLVGSAMLPKRVVVRPVRMFPLLAKRAVRLRGSPTQSEALTAARAGRAMPVTLIGVTAEQPLALVETTLKRLTPAVTLPLVVSAMFPLRVERSPFMRLP